jgi:hypothetical protein
LDIDATRKARENFSRSGTMSTTPSKAFFGVLTRGNVELRVVSRKHAPFVHGKVGVIYRPDRTSSAFMGSLNETREGW